MGTDESAQSPAPPPEPNSNSEPTTAPLFYFLDPDVHFCAHPDGPVILDVRSNRYRSFTRGQQAVLMRHVVGWPGNAHPQQPQETSLVSNDQRYLDRMITRGLLIRGPLGTPVTQVQVTRAERLLVEEDLEYRPRVRLIHWVYFVRAMIVARLMLRTRPFYYIVHRVRSRRAQAKPSFPIDMKLAQELVGVFRYLRPLLFNGPDDCVEDAVGLLEFLAPYKFYPSWVFGVRLLPWFIAHCWVQHEDMVCSGTVDELDGLVEIMVV